MMHAPAALLPRVRQGPKSRRSIDTPFPIEHRTSCAERWSTDVHCHVFFMTYLVEVS